MVIELTDSKPVVYRPYRLSYTERQQVKDMVQDILDIQLPKNLILLTQVRLY